MIRQILIAASLSAMMAPLPVYAQDQPRKLTPTIPETQIEAAEFSSPYEFLSAATSIDEFEIEAGALAERLSGTAAVKDLAASMSAQHAASMRDIRAAGKQDGVDIAKPSVDGEQQGMLAKLEALEGAEFDQAYADTQVYIHQRAIAIYRGYAEEQDSLGKFAANALPAVMDHYTMSIDLARQLGLESVVQEPDGAN